MITNYLKVSPQYLIPQHGLSRLAGSFANSRVPLIKNSLINWFVAKYKVNMSEALIEDPLAYPSFNEFFIRHLKPHCRPLFDADIISPVDGAVSELGRMEQGTLIQAKGHYYTANELFAGNDARAEQFKHGSFATLYLSPKDYHRVHIPIDGQLESMTYVPGKLFSVNPLTTSVVPKLFARNERLIMYFTTRLGPMALVMVGATIVGTIGTNWHGDIKRSKHVVDYNYSREGNVMPFSKGDELGYFKLGSTVILLFADKIVWNKELTSGSSIYFGGVLGGRS